MSGRPSFRGASELPPDQADLRREQGVERAIGQSVPEWLRGGKLVPVAMKDDVAARTTHGLGRTPKGWFIGSISGDADRVSVRQIGSDASTITLKNDGASGGLSVTLWVY